jgi:hypothetical protein
MIDLTPGAPSHHPNKVEAQPLTAVEAPPSTVSVSAQARSCNAGALALSTAETRTSED